MSPTPAERPLSYTRQAQIVADPTLCSTLSVHHSQQLMERLLTPKTPAPLPANWATVWYHASLRLSQDLVDDIAQDQPFFGVDNELDDLLLDWGDDMDNPVQHTDPKPLTSYAFARWMCDLIQGLSPPEMMSTTRELFRQGAVPDNVCTAAIGLVVEGMNDPARAVMCALAPDLLTPQQMTQLWSGLFSRVVFGGASRSAETLELLSERLSDTDVHAVFWGEVFRHARPLMPQLTARMSALHTAHMIRDGLSHEADLAPTTRKM